VELALSADWANERVMASARIKIGAKRGLFMEPQGYSFF
jgi:hypothetical protein